MSYSNPTWYNVANPYKVQESFEKAFTTTYSTIEEHFNQIDKQLKESQTDLQEQANDLRKQLTSMKDVVPGVKNKIDDMIRQFYKENKPSVSREGSNFISRGLNTRVDAMSKASLEEATSNFKTMAGYLNEASAKFVDPTTKDKIDKGDPFYLDFVTMQQTFMNNPDSIKFKRDGLNFSFSMEIEDQKNGGKKVIDMEEMAMSMASLNEDVLKIKKETFDSNQKTLNSFVKTQYDNEYAKLKQAAQGGEDAIITATDIADKASEEFVRGRMSEESIRDAYNNFIDESIINFSTKQNIFGSSSLLEGKGLSGQMIIDAINNVESDSDRSIKQDALSKILDMPANDRKAISKLLRQSNIIPEGHTEDQFFDLIDEYQIKVVSRNFADNALGSGVNSKFIPGKKQRSISAKQRNIGSSKLDKDEKSTDQMIRAGNAMRLLYNSPGGFETQVGGTIDQIGKHIRVGRYKRPIAKTSYNNGVVTMTYTYGKPDEDGAYANDDISFNMKSPDQAFDFYVATGGPSNGKGFSREMLKQFDTPQGMRMLDDPSMYQWVEWLEKQPGGADKIAQHIVNNGLRGKYEQYVQFEKRNRKKLESAMIAASRNKRNSTK